MHCSKWLVLLAALGTSAPVLAASTESWHSADQRMKQACVKASGLKNARPVTRVMLFSDRVGYSALVLQGTYPQKHMKNKRGRELCLYQRATSRASVTEADDLLP
ncbi:hypothetical protein [Winslowiella iniecta]|uniref:Membrane protein n=1 Tax=Winslowiella iniecta TaxID=1560201 RepID=A0A0L7T2S7_9GAMM|nr:hypothetical protein [Winslowiella iniecta]KOC89536.1 membrane protein [Winslowiella iniecta]KOC93912.1 membrane protein [Winslowiella iniecta]